MSDLEQNERRRLGQTTTPGGGAGNNAPQTVTGTVQTIGPLPAARAFSIESDVKAWALQCNTLADTVGLTATQIRNWGCHLPAGVEVGFDTDDGDYIVWVKDAAASDGNLRLNNRSTSYRA